MYASEAPCADCGKVDRHLVGCSLDRDEVSDSSSKWTGSEIHENDVPCKGCGGAYVHSFDCPEDPNPGLPVIPKGTKWGLTKPPTICKTCFAENGHRSNCPAKGDICGKCGMIESPIHTERLCTLRQAGKRVQAAQNTDNLPCGRCAGVIRHYWPCSNIVLVDSRDSVVQ